MKYEDIFKLIDEYRKRYGKNPEIIVGREMFDLNSKENFPSQVYGCQVLKAGFDFGFYLV